MNRVFRAQTVIAASLLCALHVTGCGAPPSQNEVDANPDPLPDGNQPDAMPTGPQYDKVFGDFLHHVDVQISAADMTLLDANPAIRVPCTIVYDGTVITAGVKLKGQSTLQPLARKPSFNIKFNEYLKKIVLANMMVSQYTVHYGKVLGHAVYRQAGLPAPQVAWALVSLNGQPKGVYLAEEAKDTQYLARYFGDGNNNGNLYEGASGVEFVDQATHPSLELKDEVEDGRNRDDLIALGEAMTTTPPAQWKAMVGAKLNLEVFARSMALDIATEHLDDYLYVRSNYYIYHNPGDDKFHFLTHGMDTSMIYPADSDINRPITGRAAILLNANPDTSGMIKEQLQWVVDNAWDVAALTALIDRGKALLASEPANPAVAAELPTLDYYAELERTWIPARLASLRQQLQSN
jgi:spore coat protein H